MKVKWINIWLALVIILPMLLEPGEANAAQAGTARPDETGKLLVSSQIKGEITLRLSGPRSYTFTLKKGKTTLYVLPGTYQYSYYPCGFDRGERISVTKKAKITLYACSYARVQFINNTGGNLRLTLTGRGKSYTLNIPPGKSIQTILKDAYNYTATAVCGTKSGYVILRGNKKWTWRC